MRDNLPRTEIKLYIISIVKDEGKELFKKSERTTNFLVISEIRFEINKRSR